MKKNQYLFRYLALALIGFADALPMPLTGSTLSIWLSESGFDKQAIGLFVLLGIPFSLKILWSPVIDFVSLPFFANKQRKGWLLFALMGMALSLIWISFIDPRQSPWLLATSILILTIFTGCLYIVGISYELESLEEDQYSSGSVYVITGYRIGLLCGGGGALYLSYLWNWHAMYRCMAGLLLLGSLLILILPEPFKSKNLLQLKRERFLQHHSLFQGFWKEVIVRPCQTFIQKPDWLAILLIVVSFKVGDQLSKVMEGPFYLSLGFEKSNLAVAYKLWGLIATIAGTIAIGPFLKGQDPLLSLCRISVINACSLFCYYALALSGKSYSTLYLTVALEHFTGGMAMTTFIYFLWKICDKGHAAVQYTLLWSIYSFKGDIIASVGGFLASCCSWHTYFLCVAFFGLSASIATWKIVGSRTIFKRGDAETQRTTQRA